MATCITGSTQKPTCTWSTSPPDNNIAYLAIDSNWYGNQHQLDSNPLTAVSGMDIQQILTYAETQGVRVFLYINNTAFENHDMEDVFRTYSDWGVAGVKYGFMGAGPLSLEKVTRTTDIVEAAARHDLMINFHDGPVHPTGLSRSYPNLITTQYCHGQLDDVRSFSPDDFLSTIFVHMLAGPVDMINGYFALDSITDRTNGGRDYDRAYPAIDSTVTTEVARILIYPHGPDRPARCTRGVREEG